MDDIATLERVLGKKADMEVLPLQLGDMPTTYADVPDRVAHSTISRLRLSRMG